MGIFPIFGTKKTDTVIERAMAALADHQQLAEATAYFRSLCDSVPGFQALDNLTFQYRDYLINAGIYLTLQAHAKGLEAVKGMKLSCAPEFVCFTLLKNGTDCVLITRIPGLKGHRLLPFRENRQSVTEKMQQRLLADLKKLGSYHRVPTAMFEPDTWYLLPNADVILLNRFAPMTAVHWTSKEDHKAVIQQLQEQVRELF